jgi:hypothetical protein
MIYIIVIHTTKGLGKILEDQKILDIFLNQVYLCKIQIINTI